MNYIVFDLEWNQSPGGKRWSNSRLPFEIIEIGAIKLNEEKEIVDSFQRLIKPQVYNWIHDSIHEVIHMNYKDLQNGTLFPQAITEFLEWCGEEYIFFTWGNQDVMELQRNMKYYGKLSLLKGPVTYYDVQKLFVMKKMTSAVLWNLLLIKWAWRRKWIFTALWEMLIILHVFSRK